MRKQLFTIAVGVLAAVYWQQSAVFAEPLPTFADFRRMDQTRRLTGQLQTAEFLKITRLDPELIASVVQHGSNDTQLVWGAVELLTAWPARRTLFEALLATTSNSVPIALRFACAAARQRDLDTALQWARFCKEKDPDNLVPWLVESWVLVERKQRQQLAPTLPVWVTNYRDYTVEACQARIHLLEQIGYSAFAARRLGFKADSDALLIAQELCNPPVAEMTRTLLKQSAESLQQRRQFLLHEFVGQTLERKVLALQPDADRAGEVTARLEMIGTRRERLRLRLAEIERNTVDYATEAQMIQYFDDVLASGEESAMQKLIGAVKTPAPSSRDTE